MYRLASFSWLASIAWITVCFIIKYSGISSSGISEWNNGIIILSGLGFGWLSSYSLKRKLDLFRTKILQETGNRLNGENIIQRDGMNHFRGIISDGGIGYLLQDKLVFIPHKFNFSSRPVTVLFSEIAKISSYKILGFVDTGLKIVLKSGKIEKFVIDKSGEFYCQLMNIINE
jgi:hypothetical protein